ncbi:low molecular weight protein-tyrosine-phosphatase [Brumimicrobium sp.]|uniref:low molecular weight protein-tyrosine-phosphatase n=1 Tax=Brumimicrobium sp. TaxID=2029867 RepID=UPI0026226F6A|nr:low molecular weight protein-tyrosine-phosphatase [uncultured Brumimicrobium sp.]
MKVLMVCLGNICRSPMADGLMRKKVQEHGLDVVVDSAGTGDWHVGDAPDPRMIETAKRNGVPIDDLRGRQFKVADFDEFDRIVVMDKSNFANVTKLARDEKDVQKVELFLNLTHPGKDLEVPDPYFGGDEGFQDVFDMLDAGTDVLLKELKN